VIPYGFWEPCLGLPLQVTYTDSWDDSTPTGCQGANNAPGAAVVPAISDDRCFDGLRNFNQIRPAVFDGGFAFADYDLDHINDVRATARAQIDNYYTNVGNLNLAYGDQLQLGLLPGDYIVAAATPPGYHPAGIKPSTRASPFLAFSMSMTATALFPPFATYNFDGGWFVESAPQFSANWNAPNSERWVIPLGGGVGKITKLGTQPIALRLHFYWNVERPENAPEALLRFTITLLFPK